MKDFFELYKPMLIDAVLVVVGVVVLQILTKVLYNWLLKLERKKYPKEDPHTLNLVRRILSALWIVIGIIGLIFVFSDPAKDEMILKNLRLVLYLGFLAVATIVAAASTNMWFRNSIAKKVLQQEDTTNYKFLRYVSVFLIYSLGILFGLLAFPSLRGVAQTALGGAGLIAVIIGVASQEALANLIGGIFIIAFKPFKVGQIIKITDAMVGTVTDITLRHTVIRNWENKMIVIPNAIINKEKLTNYDMGEFKTCERIEIKISYNSDIDLAKKIMQEECETHPLLIDNRTTEDIKAGKPKVKTAVISLSDLSMTIRAWTWSNNYSESFQLKIDVLESIKKRFDKEGIEMPFPYRAVVMNEERN